ncbi:MAG: B12-binding domain-containing radical SAM protein [Ferruginibacter sp.]
MPVQALLITPPFTQLNTPYPATAYLKGFLNTLSIPTRQADLGIEVTLQLFSKNGLIQIFNSANVDAASVTANISRIYTLKDDYIQTIDAVIAFLQGKNPTLAHLIAKRGYLPEAERFQQLDDLIWAFGNMGIQDKAKYLATMYLEDISDFIKATVDEHFGFSRYAEKLGRSASTFDALDNALKAPYTLVDSLLVEALHRHITDSNPQLVAISVPFPGNVYAAFRCAQYIRTHFPSIKIALGGGYANTELRSINDLRVFNFVHFITLDDGETPIEQLLKFCKGTISSNQLKRTFLVENNQIVYINNPACTDYKQGQVGTPDYSDLWLDQYISAIEIINPMHSLWSDGRWNKLTMAHGCYWGKCTFCDISLDYISRYEPLTASILCDRMETLIQQTGCNGFHFVDEAAPPALMRSLAIEIIRRQLTVSWWTNIRFEKSFTRDLCLLLRASGCIGVSGGLEVASDRLLQLIQKGVTVQQVAKVNKNFTEAGIMVHAYLMYGFPTQTAQETIDSLEIVRQLFETGVLQSGFWHLFTMTSHSPVGLNPEKFKVIKTSTIGSFANNDEQHEDPTGADHELFSYGLKKSLVNYMHGNCLDHPLKNWFDFKVPKTTIDSDYIQQILNEPEWLETKPETKLLFIGKLPILSIQMKSKKGNQWEVAQLVFETKTTQVVIQTTKETGYWLLQTLEGLSIYQPKILTREIIKKDFEDKGLGDFDLFWDNKPITTLHKVGLLSF